MNFQDLMQAPTVSEVLIAVGAFFVVLLGCFGFKGLLNREVRKGKSANIDFAVCYLFLTVLFIALLFLIQSANVLLIFSFILLTFFFFLKRSDSFKVVEKQGIISSVLNLTLAYLMAIILFGSSSRGAYLITFGLILAAVLGITFDLFPGGRESGSKLTSDKEKLEVSKVLIAFILSFTLNIFLFYFRLFQVKLPVLGLFNLSVLLTVIWLFGSRSNRFFWIILSESILILMLSKFQTTQMIQFTEGLVLAALVAVASYKIGFLSLSGSLMTFLMATFIFGLGSWAWAIPILTFFILSSLLSKFGKQQKQKFKDTFEKSGVRDYQQVLANGGIPWALVVLNFFWPHDWFYALYLLSLAVATADTWSTEIGVLSKSRPILITSFRHVDPGVSGAISFYGTFGGLLGAAIVLGFGTPFASFPVSEFFILLLFALIGDFFDSLIGATLQGQYQCVVCSKYTEKKIHCNSKTKLLRGYRLIDNDTVNLSANIMTLIFYLLYRII